MKLKNATTRDLLRELDKRLADTQQAWVSRRFAGAPFEVAVESIQQLRQQLEFLVIEVLMWDLLDIIPEDGE